jgi:hypothetical protein
MQDLNGLGGDGWERVLVEEMLCVEEDVLWAVKQWFSRCGIMFGEIVP